jgi:plastocyanin domain-containing protein
MKSTHAITIALTLVLSGAVFAAEPNSAKKITLNDADRSSCCAVNGDQDSSQKDSQKESPENKKEPEPQLVTITLTDKGYEPASIKLQKDIPAKVTFVRKSKTTCGTEIVIPEYQIKRELPLDERVVVEFTPAKTGEFKFACGMNMLRGKIVVREKVSPK